jgi:hypothetical protein
MKTAMQNPDHPGKRNRSRQQTIVLPGALDVTARQVQILMSTLQALIPFVMKGGSLHFPGAGDNQPEMDGEVVSSAAATAIKLFDRIDVLVADSSRWDLSRVEKFEKQALEANEAQQKALKEATRPCMLMRPRVGYNPLQDVWVVFTDAKEGLAALAGVGDSPEAAMEDFDRQYERKIHAYEMQKMGPEQPATTPGPEEQGDGVSRAEQEIRTKPVRRPKGVRAKGNRRDRGASSDEPGS